MINSQNDYLNDPRRNAKAEWRDEGSNAFLK